MKIKKYLCKWKFQTIDGWKRLQKTVYAENKLEAEEMLYPYTPRMDKLISINQVKE